MVAEVYFSSNRFPTGLRTCLFRTTNCWKVDSSLNKTFPSHRQSNEGAFWQTLASSSSLWVSTLVFLQAYRILIQIPC